MSDELFGRRLRSERERRRITLESIAANTKISVALLQSLERDDVSRWPSGIFRRSFIRSYADAIGLDPDEAVKQFLDCHPDRVLLLPGEAPEPPRPAPGTVLRLTLAEAPQPFSAGQLLADARTRLSAVAWDAGTTLVFAITSYLFFESFWAPLGVFMLFYYLGSVLILGNTPGVSLFAPGMRRAAEPEKEEKEELDELTPDAFEHALR